MATTRLKHSRNKRKPEPDSTKHDYILIEITKEEFKVFRNHGIMALRMTCPDINIRMELLLRRPRHKITGSEAPALIERDMEFSQMQGVLNTGLRIALRCGSRRIAFDIDKMAYRNLFSEKEPLDEVIRRFAETN